MSYSRWSNSVWYTYSDVNGGFTVCDEKNFSDEELKDIDQCLKFFDGSGYTSEEVQELRGYMEQYVENEKDNRPPRDINEYRKGLVCLVPRPDSDSVITCHEKTLCDCKVLEIFSAYDKLQAELALANARLQKAEALLSELIDAIETVRCTGPNQKEVLSNLYAIVDRHYAEVESE